MTDAERMVKIAGVLGGRGSADWFVHLPEPGQHFKEQVVHLDCSQPNDRLAFCFAAAELLTDDQRAAYADYLWSVREESFALLNAPASLRLEALCEVLGLKEEPC